MSRWNLQVDWHGCTDIVRQRGNEVPAKNGGLSLEKYNDKPDGDH